MSSARRARSSSLTRVLLSSNLDKGSSIPSLSVSEEVNVEEERAAELRVTASSESFFTVTKS